MEKHFIIIYWLAFTRQPLVRFHSLMNLAALLGAFVGLEHVLKGGKQLYTSDNFLYDALDVKSSMVHQTVQKTLAASQILGVMIDETMDVSTISQMIIYFRALTPKGVKVFFGGIEPLLLGVNADVVTATLLFFLLKNKVPLKKVFSFGSDGCSTMLGHLNGVTSRLLARNLLLIAIHCVCHREALACKDAAMDIAYLKDVFFPMTEHVQRYLKVLKC